MATKLRQYTLDANNGLTDVAYVDVPAGSVTSVGQTFTGGLISVSGSPVTTTGTLALTVAGTSGGVPYFSGAATWASSAALAANALVLGGGAGAAPATTTTGTGVVTALGVNVGSAGAVVLNGGALGTPASGVLTNCTGTAAGLTAGTVTTNANLTGHVTSVGNAAVLGSFTVAQLNAAISDADVATGGGTATGTNTGDQTNITGNAATVTTNANLTGPITSTGNATSVASQTGTGSTFAMQDSPTFTGTMGAAIIDTSNYIKSAAYGWFNGAYLAPAGANADRFADSSVGFASNTYYIGNASINTTSDIRWKANIRRTTRDALSLVNKLAVIDHTWDDPSDQCENNKNTRGVWMGVSAQQAIEHTPWLVNAPDKDCITCKAGKPCEEHPSPWRFEHGYAVVLLLRALQQLDAKFESYKALHP
jgi:hypothetical protein